MDSGELRNVDLAAATAIRFTDPKLQLQFKDYLAALTGARSKDKRSVYIDSTDSKSREVRAEYIMPMPAWKSSYRLLFGENGAQPTLEGWAIVDNTTGEDWTNVRLSLVSGKPISFISQLYAPKYITRLGADLAEDQAVAPTVYSGAVQSEAAPVRAAASMPLVAGTALAGGVWQVERWPSAAARPILRCFPLQAADSISSIVRPASGTGDRRSLRIRHRDARHRPQRRIRHDAVPAAERSPRAN